MWLPADWLNGPRHGSWLAICHGHSLEQPIFLNRIVLYGQVNEYGWIKTCLMRVHGCYDKRIVCLFLKYCVERSQNNGRSTSTPTFPPNKQPTMTSTWTIAWRNSQGIFGDLFKRTADKAASNTVRDRFSSQHRPSPDILWISEGLVEASNTIRETQDHTRATIRNY